MSVYPMFVASGYCSASRRIVSITRSRVYAMRGTPSLGTRLGTQDHRDHDEHEHGEGGCQDVLHASSTSMMPTPSLRRSMCLGNLQSSHASACSRLSTQ